MSIAIRITTHAPLADVERLLPEIRALVEELEESQADGKPPTTARVFGNDYNGPEPTTGIDFDPMTKGDGKPK